MAARQRLAESGCGARIVSPVIQKNTVFVLGAGASCSIGFPTSKMLMHSLRGGLNPGAILHKVCLTSGVEAKAIAELQTAIENSGLASIDSLVAHRPEFMRPAKIALVAHLLPQERASISHIRDPERSWYMHLFRAMLTQHDGEFVHNNVRFITYNYDRSLEFALMNYLAHTRGYSLVQAAGAIDGLDIAHMHGTLGKLKELRGGAVEYGANYEDAGVMDAAVSEMHLVHEGARSEPIVRVARKWLHEARQVVFMGFAFHLDNMKYLDVQNQLSTTEVYVFAKGMLGAERANIAGNFKLPRYVRIDDSSVDCTAFLREHVTLE